MSPRIASFSKNGVRLLSAPGTSETRADGIGEIAGIAQHVAGRHGGRIGGGEDREQRMAIAEADPFTRNGRHGRCRAVIHYPKAQSVGADVLSNRAAVVGAW
jgi:hypothetical protein